MANVHHTIHIIVATVFFYARCERYQQKIRNKKRPNAAKKSLPALVELLEELQRLIIIKYNVMTY